MQREAFYDRLAAAIGRTLTSLEVSLLDIGCEGNRFRERQPEFLPLEDAERRLAEGGIGYWLYDRRSQTWLLNLSTGNHTVLAGTLYGIYNSCPMRSHDELAERYIDEHYGFYISGALQMYIPIKSSTYELSEAEQVFEKAKGRLQWRGID